MSTDMGWRAAQVNRAGWCNLADKDSQNCEGRTTRVPLQVACALAVLLAPLLSSAGVNSWTPIPIPGGVVNRIVHHPTRPEIVYLAAYAGFYRSANGGQSWQLIKEDFFNGPVDIAVDAAHPDRVFVVASDSGLFTSDDAGLTLQVLATLSVSDQPFTQVEISKDGSTIYVGGGTSVYRSTDDGHSWQRRPSIVTGADSLRSLLVDPRNADTVFAHMQDHGGFSSLDGGESWQQASIPVADATTSLAFSSAGPRRIWAGTTQGVWVSDDLGASWAATAMTGRIPSVAVDPQNAAVVYAACFADDASNGVYRSTDGGASWVNIQKDARTGGIDTLAINPVQSGNLLVAGSEDVLGTSDGGGTWSARSAGLSISTVYTLSAAGGSDRIYTGAASGGIYFLEGGATTAQAVNNETLRQLTASPARLSTEVVLAQTGTVDRLFVAGSQLARSEDGGNSWTLFGSAAFDFSPVTALADSPLDVQLILAGTFRGLFRTGDGGDHWSPVSGLPADSEVHSIAFARGPEPVAYASVQTEFDGIVGHGVYKSVDGGENWIAANGAISSSVVQTIAVDPHSPEVLYAATDQGLMKTTDAGATWSALTWADSAGGNDAQAVAVDPVHSSILYAARPGFVARSVDGGETWQPLRPHEARPVWPVHALICDPRRPNLVLLATNDFGIQQMRIEPDLSLEVDASSVAIVEGSAAQATFTVQNLGPFHVTGATTTIRLPDGATNVTAIASVGTCTQTQNVVTCSQPVLETGASTTIDLTASYESTGTYDMTASLEGQQPDPDTSNNTASVTTTVSSEPPPPPSPPPSSGSSGGGGSGSTLLLIVLAFLGVAQRASHCGHRRRSLINPMPA